MPEVMVELLGWLGDGYGVVETDHAGRVIRNPARKVTTYSDGSPMDSRTARILSAESVTLIDRGVRVSPSAVQRIIGPVDCPEALRVRLRRYTKNWSDTSFIGSATDAEIVAIYADLPVPDPMFGGDVEAILYRRVGALRSKYAPAS